MEEQDETGLLERAAKGETEAFRRLHGANHAVLFRFAYRPTGTVDIAGDLTRECFVRLMVRTKVDEERGSLRRYLYDMMRNLARQR